LVLGVTYILPLTGHGLWFGAVKQRNVPIRALLRFGNVKLENVKVASVAGGCGAIFCDGKVRISTPDPRQDGNGFVLGIGV
jgi:hypothetical protein